MWCYPKKILDKIAADQAGVTKRFEELTSFVRVHMALLADLEAKMEESMVNMDELRAEVARNGDAVKSAVALMQGLFAAYNDALNSGKDDSEVVAAVAEITAKMKSQTDELAAAVVENTPAEEPVEEAPVEPAPEVVEPDVPAEPVAEEPVA